MEQFFRRATLQELLVSHAVPGLVGMISLLFLVDLLTPSSVAGGLGNRTDLLPFITIAVIAGALVAGPAVDATRHFLLDGPIYKYRKSGRRLENRQLERKQAWELLAEQLGPNMSASDKLALYDYLRSAVYHWGEFYGNTALVLVLASLLGIQYCFAVKLYFLIPLIGVVIAVLLFRMCFRVIADYHDLIDRVFSSGERNEILHNEGTA